MNFTKDYLIASTHSTSKIYELYCLLRLLSMFTDDGFVISQSERFPYAAASLFKVSNTYYLERNDEMITLYYEPSIGSYDSQVNDIDLFRTSNGSPYTPDFLIQRHVGGNVKSAIFDAKLSTIDSLSENRALSNSLFKYVCSLESVSGNKMPQFMWLLAGRAYRDANEFSRLQAEVEIETASYGIHLFTKDTSIYSFKHDLYHALSLYDDTAAYSWSLSTKSYEISGLYVS